MIRRSTNRFFYQNNKIYEGEILNNFGCFFTLLPFIYLISVHELDEILFTLNKSCQEKKS